MGSNHNKHSQSVIESTLFKLSFIIFSFIILLAAVVGESVLEREVLRLEAELGSSTSKLQGIIQPQIYRIEEMKRDDHKESSQILAELIELMALSTRDRAFEQGTFGYFDYEHSVLLTANGVIDDISFLDDIGKNHEDYDLVYTLSSARKIVVARPVFYREYLTGYAVGFTDISSIFLNSTRQVSLVLVLALSLAASVIYLIKRHFNQLRTALVNYSRAIVNQNIEPNATAQLPELDPVITTIKNHTEHLVVVNSELEKSKQKLTKILDGISDGFFSLDRNWCFTFINEGAIKLLGLDSQSVGKVIWEQYSQLIASSLAEKLLQASNSGETIYWQEESTTQPGRFFEYQVYPFDRGLTVIIRDITELNRQNSEIARLERLNLIGQMAAGISHEIRNPLTTVKGFLQLLGAKESYQQDREHIGLMISEIDRANSIISDFLSLGKIGLKHIAQCNLNTIIELIYPMLQADAFSQDKEVDLQLGDIPEVMVNESEIKQLLLNLVRNGLEVTPSKGVVHITTYTEDDQIILSIKDQGPGISEEIRDKIGTPFFTTKDNGTGLGLAISIGIAQRHNAILDFESSSQGTTFFVKFPREFPQKLSK